MLRISGNRNHPTLYRGCGNSNSSSAEVDRDSRVNRYAKCKDFRQVFLENLDSLFQLCVLLMGDDHNAEQYLLDALDDCVRARRVFRDWALPWAKRTLIKNAICMLKARPENATPLRVPEDLSVENSDIVRVPPSPALAVLALPDFERLVLVMSVFERYSDQHCAFLLGCSVEKICAARTRALGQISSSSDMGSEISLDRTKNADLTQTGSPFGRSVERL